MNSVEFQVVSASTHLLGALTEIMKCKSVKKNIRSDVLFYVFLLGVNSC